MDRTQITIPGDKPYFLNLTTHLSEFATVEMKSENVFLLHFHYRPDIFPFQRLAITAPHVIPSYCWSTGFLGLEKQAEEEIYFLVEKDFQLHTLGASHPTTSRLTIEELSPTSRGYRRKKVLFDFYDSHGILIFHAIRVVAFLSIEDEVSLKVKRDLSKKKMLTTSDTTFPFADPLLAGCISPEAVFISSPSPVTNGFIVRCLVSLKRGLEQHAYLHGSGDHVNSPIIDVVFQQIATAVARKSATIFPNLPPGGRLIRVSEKLRLKKVVELGIEFTVQFSIIDQKIQQPKANGTSISGTPFEVKIQQFGQSCYDGIIDFLPLFLSRT